MTLGEVVDAQGVNSTVEDGDLVAGACVLLKLVDPDGGVRLSIAWSDGLSWLERVGMLRVAELDERSASHD